MSYSIKVVNVKKEEKEKTYYILQKYNKKEKRVISETFVSTYIAKNLISSGIYAYTFVDGKRIKYN